MDIDTLSSLFDTIKNSIVNYQSYLKQNEIQHFNVFCIISDVYYRENFHSDIMKVFLDPLEKHHQGYSFLLKFIDAINNASTENHQKIKLNEDYYKRNVNVYREKGKIDILIKGDKHLIIIENKIHDAKDMNRQLPRYVDYVSKNYKEYVLDAIVYIPLNEYKEPDTSTWMNEHDDYERVCSKLVILPAYSSTNKINLVDSWLMPSYQICSDENSKATLKQYIELIKGLSNSLMDIRDLNQLAYLLKTKEGYVSMCRTLTGTSSLGMWAELCDLKTKEISDEISKENINWQNFKKSLKPDGSYCEIGSFDTKAGELKICVGAFVDKSHTDTDDFYNVQIWNESEYGKSEVDHDIKNYISALIPGIADYLNSSTYFYDSNYQKELKCDIAWHFKLGEEEKIISIVKMLVEGLQ